MFEASERSIRRGYPRSYWGDLWLAELNHRWIGVCAARRGSERRITLR